MVYGNKEKEKLITGFKFIPIYKEKRGEKYLDLLKVEYLNNGNLIGRDGFEVDGKQAEKLRKKLMKIVRENEGLEEKEKNINAVNMFKIIILRTHEELFDIKVEFIKNGDFFSETCFYSLNKNNLEKIRKILSSNIKYNLTIERQCDAVTWIDLVSVCKVYENNYKK